MNTPQTGEGPVPSYPTGLLQSISTLHNINAIMEYSVVRCGDLIGWVWRGAGGIKIVTPELVDMDPFEKVELLMSPPELAEEWVKCLSA